MKTTKLFLFASLFALTLGFVSCSEDDEIIETLPIDIQADNQWVEDEIALDGEIWYKVTCAAGSTTAYLEWAEASGHGESKSYTGDVMLSAYQLDGITPYIENKDNGYGGSAKSFALANNEVAYLVKVTIGGTSTPGTFAIRANATAVLSLTYIDLAIGDTWTTATIAQDQIIGYKVNYSGQKKLAIMWAEAGSPEAGYTANILGSVFKKDGQTPYKDVANNKDFLDKENSASNNPKYILTDTAENNFKIHLKNTTPGTFAIKVVEVPL